MGAYALHATHDGRELAQKARDAKERKRQAQVDPTGELAQRDPQELAKRLQQLQNLEMEKVRFAKLQKRQAREAEATHCAARISVNESPGNVSTQNETAPVVAGTASVHSPVEQTVTKAQSGGDAIVTRRQTTVRRANAGTTQPRARNSKKAAKDHGDTYPHHN